MSTTLQRAGLAPLSTTVAPFVVTHTKTEVSLVEPMFETIKFTDIAHALARIQRWTGHHNRNCYSVAQHSVLVSRLVYARTMSADAARLGLMHDATEAYLGDVSSPLKSLLPEYKKIEERFADLIARRYGLQMEWFSDVKRADTEALVLEADQLLEVDAATWGVKEMPPHTRIPSWSVATAQLEFTEEARRLGIRERSR